MKRTLMAIGMSMIVGFAGAGFIAPPATSPAHTTPAKPTTGKPTTTPPAKAPDAAKPDAKDPKNDGPTLKVGSAAPALAIETFVKGKEIKGMESGKVYVVEFWATWCGPCIKGIPHLTETQKKYPQVTVIGMAASEMKDKGGADTRLNKVKQFVEKQGDKMAYTVGYESNRKMSKEWLEAAGRDTIPSAFIVGGDGKILWIGNPNKPEFETELEKAVKAAEGTKKA